MSYRDAGHRPHATHPMEAPMNTIVEAPYHLRVTLDAWGPQKNLFTTMYDMLQANWGEIPSRTVNREQCMCYIDAEYNEEWEHLTKWCELNREEREYIISAFKGQTLPQILEMLSFSFLVDGCTRASTHQLVRTRIGAAYMQHGGRDNDWRHRPWIMPETIRRACLAMGSDPADLNGLEHCVTNPDVLQRYCCNAGTGDYPDPLGSAIEDYLDRGRQLYAALVDAGIPWQDARRVLWMGTSTYLHVNYNYAALRGVLANRLEHVMDWEINCIAQLMLREVNIHCPPMFGQYLRSHSDRAGRAVFSGLESWPPDGKYPVPEEHRNLPRTHRREQNPFWVLSDDSIAGGEIRWISTNGEYPTE